jgi:hypothetical protein
MTEEKFLTDPAGRDERTYLTGDLGRMIPGGFLIHPVWAANPCIGVMWNYS